MIDTEWSDPDEAARQMSGNWKQNRDFAWHVRYDDPRNETAVHCALYTRDSDPLTLSNASQIEKALQEADPRGLSWHMERHNHWAVGWLEVAILYPWRKNGKTTTAWRTFCGLMESLEQYPVLDDEDYYQRVEDETVEPCLQEVAHEAERYANNELDILDIDVTADHVRDFMHENKIEYEAVDNDSWLRFWEYNPRHHEVTREELAERVAVWVVEQNEKAAHEARLDELEARGELYTQRPLPLS
jgi:hypothetical protein